MSLFREPTFVGVLVEFEGVREAADPSIPVREVEAAAGFIDVPGLISKTFLGDPTTELIAGFYVWESEKRARDFYATQEWQAGAAQFGVKPKFRFFRVGAVAQQGRVLAPAARAAQPA